MNRFLAGTALLLSCWPCPLNLQAESPDIANARQHGARGRVTLRVVDSIGKPVEHAQLSVALFPSDSYASADVREGQTDGDGCLSVEGTTVGDMTYTVTKSGYYRTTGKYLFYRCGESGVQDGRWQPWNPTNTVVLKEHRNPVAMYAMNVDVPIPAGNAPIGFDLVVGDWVAPHGRGAIADLLIKYTASYEGPQTFSKRLELSFSNPRDGVQAIPLDETSDFVSLYAATEDGYTPTLVDEQARTRTRILKRSETAEGQYLVFRVRSVVNEEGKVVSANYGKIYSPNLLDPIIEYGRMEDADRVMFTYYFNPTANDRNLEFDPARNLLANPERMRVYNP